MPMEYMNEEARRRAAGDKSAPSSSHGSAVGYVCPTMPIEMLEMLEDTQMLDLHEDNGPGRVECPVCGESITMRWNWGKRLDSPEEIKHHVFCPVGWAKRRRD